MTEKEKTASMKGGEPGSASAVSRRESLRRATAALALGLGAPAGLLAATRGPEPRGYRLAFYSRETERDVDVEIPERVAKILASDLVFDELKVEWSSAERRANRTLASYRLMKI